MASTTKAKTRKTKPKDSSSLNEDEVRSIESLRQSFDGIREELSKVIVGQEDAIEKIFICMLSNGHTLLMGVPGLAKTLLVNSIAKPPPYPLDAFSLRLTSCHPACYGTEILQDRKDGEGREFTFIKGPIFASVCLPTKSTGLLQRPNRLSLRRCRKNELP